MKKREDVDGDVLTMSGDDDDEGCEGFLTLGL